jgi:hypothetical protein
VTNEHPDQGTQLQDAAAYVKPEIRDYGTLREATAGSSSGSKVDVPLGTPVPPFNIFS